MKEKNGWNETLSKLEFILDGELEPVSCSDIKCIIINTLRINGVKKCNEKNRDKVAWLTENPPHTHSTIIWPIYGIDEIRFVITLVPQKDICPHGKTYPKKAVAIKIKTIITPEAHTWVNLKEEKIIPRAMCM